MATTFTTWQALYEAMQNALADFAANRGQFLVASYSITNGGNSRQLTYRTFAEFKEGLLFVKQMADIETGTAVRRTNAKQGGGGRW